MIKKGSDLFFPVACWTVWKKADECCKVCKFPFKRLCKHICKYRKATLKEAFDDIFKRGDKN